jgi:hypothetical protein
MFKQRMVMNEKAYQAIQRGSHVYKLRSAIDREPLEMSWWNCMLFCTIVATIMLIICKSVAGASARENNNVDWANSFFSTWCDALQKDLCWNQSFCVSEWLNVMNR